MSYPLPLQVHVIWHPDSDAECRHLAEKIYLTFNRDAYQPLLPGIGIPVFFRHASRPDNENGAAPAPITVPDTEFDMRVALLTPSFVLDQTWQDYLENCAREVREKSSVGALIAFGLAPDPAQSE